MGASGANRRTGWKRDAGCRKFLLAILSSKVFFVKGNLF